MARSSYGIYIIHYLVIACFGYMMKMYTHLTPVIIYVVLAVAVFSLSPLLYEILHRIAKEYVDLKHPDGYYDLCGENVPTSAITHWMLIPQLKGGEE